MNSQELFVQLVYRLPRVADAMVLHALLRRRADEEELATSRVRIANRLLEDRLTESQTRYSLKALERMGLVKFRVHANYRTRISVDRRALLDLLLDEPLPDRLPGLQDESFPFLQYLAERRGQASPDVPANPTTAAQAIVADADVPVSTTKH